MTEGRPQGRALHSTFQVPGEDRFRRLGDALLRNGIRTHYLDVGAAGGLRAEWEEAARQGYVTPILVDFEPGEDHLNHIIGNADRTREFFITAMPGCSSCRRPLESRWLRESPLGYYFRLEKVVQVEEVRASTLIDDGRLVPPELLKLDVQGYEYECLEGFGDHLDRVLAIELETQLKPIYEGQKLFLDLYRFLANRGFVLRHLRPQGDWGDGEIVEMNAFYSRRKRDLGGDAARQLDFWEAVLRIPRPVEHVRRDLHREVESGLWDGYAPEAPWST